MSSLSRRNWLITYIFLLFLAFGTGVFAYLYYMAKQYRNQINSQLSTQLQNSDATNKQLETSLNKLQNELNEISGNKTHVLIFKVNELINLANQELVIYNDILGSIRLLTQTKRLLDNNNDPIFIQLKYVLSRDLAKLNNLHIVDKVLLSGELDELSNEVSHLDISINNLDTKISKKSDEIANNSKWFNFLNSIKDSLFGLVSIVKTSQSQGEVLLPKQEAITISNIKINLLFAKVALIERNQNCWTYGLNNAKILVTGNFLGYQNIDKISKKLDNLQQINIGNANANIDDVLVELNKLNNLQ